MTPVPCRINRPIDQRVLGWCADEKVWKFGIFMKVDGVTWFKHEGQGPVYGEHEVSHWMTAPPAPHGDPQADSNRYYAGIVTQ